MLIRLVYLLMVRVFGWLVLLLPRQLRLHRIVLNCDSEYGLSSVTCGREWDWVMPRSASSSATGLDVIEDPRPAWMLSCPRLMPCLAQVAAISFSARANAG